MIDLITIRSQTRETCKYHDITHLSMVVHLHKDANSTPLSSKDPGIRPLVQAAAAAAPMTEVTAAALPSDTEECGAAGQWRPR